MIYSIPSGVQLRDAGAIGEAAASMPTALRGVNAEGISELSYTCGAQALGREAGMFANPSGPSMNGTEASTPVQTDFRGNALSFEVPPKVSFYVRKDEH